MNKHIKWIDYTDRITSNSCVDTGAGYDWMNRQELYMANVINAQKWFNSTNLCTETNMFDEIIKLSNEI